MSEILRTPDSFWTAFFKGAGWMALGVGSPVTVGVLTMSDGGAYDLWGRLGFIGVLVGGLCLASGLARAIWAVVQRWAYDWVTGDPFH